MYQTALLLLTGPIRLVVESIGQYLNNANKKVIKRLYVKLEPEFSKPFSKSDSYHLSSALPILYNKASSICKTLDVRVLLTNIKQPRNDTCAKLNFDVILTNSEAEDNFISRYVDDHFKSKSCSVIKLDNLSTLREESKELQSHEYESFKTVCLGGTFDRLHNGHKVLLSEAVLRASEKLIVGVSDVQILKKKVLYELIEPIEKRISEVSQFLLEVDPSLLYDVVPITDPFGPTITVSDIDCIVVTTETKLGGEKVNTEREKRDMHELKMIVVDLVENTERISHEEEKISSSTNRMHLLGTPLKSTQITPIKKRPYCILFRGHFMSGKSFIATRFQLLGLPVLCCDEMLRALFHKDAELRSKVAERMLLNTDSIDFEKLALHCLKSKENKLWLADLIQTRLKSSLQLVLKVYAEQGARVVLVKDSSILEGCNLEIDVNEIWAAILPTHEAMKKLKEFYNSSDEEISEIVNFLPANKDYVETANVLFCNMWSTDAIQAQVDRAMLYVNSIKDSMLPIML